MVQVEHQWRLRLLEGLLALTTLSPISNVHASVFGRSELYNAINARDSRAEAYPQQPALIRGLYPRGYNVELSLPMESSWRYIGGGSGPDKGINLGLFRRQDEDVEAYCNQGMHVCRAFDVVGCCGNDAYCIVTSEKEGKCCPLGKVCGEDPCSMTATFCSQVVTLTNTANPAEVTTTTTSACCGRPCSLTMHLCDEKFGGFCCGNDAVCISSKMCRATPNPNTPTTSVPTKVTFTTEECPTGSFACAENAGGGCCPNNMICTEVSSKAGCALSGSGVKTREIFTDNGATGGAIVTDKPTETPSLTGSSDAASTTNDDDDDNVISSNSADSSDSGLSAGAKAGIGIGAAVGVLALVAIGAFFFIRHRKSKAAAAAAAQPPPPPNQPQQDPQMAQYGYGGQPYYAPGTQYPQGYYPAPQASPQMAPVQGYYDPSEALKYQQQPMPVAEAYGDEVQPQQAVLLPNTEHKTNPSELQ